MITMGCGPGCDRRGNGFGGSDPELYRDGFGVSIGAGHYVKFGGFGNGMVLRRQHLACGDHDMSWADGCGHGQALGGGHGDGTGNGDEMIFDWGNGEGLNFGYAGHCPSYHGRGCGKHCGDGLGNSWIGAIVPRGRKSLTLDPFIFDRSTVGVIGAMT